MNIFSNEREYDEYLENLREYEDYLVTEANDDQNLLDGNIVIKCVAFTGKPKNNDKHEK